MALVAAVGIFAVLPLSSALAKDMRGGFHGSAHRYANSDRDRYGWREQHRGIRMIRHGHPGIMGDGYRHGDPPGWRRGRKTGWGNCDLPPGQAKKYGCSPYFGGRGYWRHDRDDWRIRQRPHVHAGGSILIH